MDDSYTDAIAILEARGDCDSMRIANEIRELRSRISSLELQLNSALEFRDSKTRASERMTNFNVEDWMIDHYMKEMGE